MPRSVVVSGFAHVFLVYDVQVYPMVWHFVACHVLVMHFVACELVVHPLACPSDQATVLAVLFAGCEGEVGLWAEGV